MASKQNQQDQIQAAAAASGGQMDDAQQEATQQSKYQGRKADIVMVDDDDGEQPQPMPDLLELSTRFENVDYENTRPISNLLVHRGDTMQAIVSKSKKLADIVQSGCSVAVAIGRMQGPQDTPLNEWELCKQRFPSAEASIYERWARGATLPRMNWSNAHKDDKTAGHQAEHFTNASAPSETARALKAIYKDDAPALVTEEDVHNFLNCFPSLRPLVSAHVRLQRLRDAGDLPQLLRKQREDAEWRATRLATAQIEEELHALMSQAQKYKAMVESNLRVLQHRMAVVGGSTQEAVIGMGAIKMEEDLCEDLFSSSPTLNPIQEAAPKHAPPAVAAAVPQRAPAPAAQHQEPIAIQPGTQQVSAIPTPSQRPREHQRSLSISSAPPTASAEMPHHEYPPMYASTPAALPFGQSQTAHREIGTPATASQQRRNRTDAAEASSTVEMTQDTQGSNKSRSPERNNEMDEERERQEMHSFMSLSGDGERDDGEDDEDEEELDASETVALVRSSPDRAESQRQQMLQQRRRSQSPSPVTPGHLFQVPNQLRAALNGQSGVMTEQHMETTQIEMQSQSQTQTFSPPGAQRPRAPLTPQHHNLRSQRVAPAEDVPTSFLPSSSKRSADPVVEIEVSPHQQHRSQHRSGPAQPASSRKKTKTSIQHTASRGAESSSLTSDDGVEDQMDEDKENEEQEQAQAKSPRRATATSKAKSFSGGGGGRASKGRGGHKGAQGISDLTNTGGGGGSSNRRQFQPCSTG